MKNVIVIGAGVGGLTTAAILARSGLNVTVLESHIYPGGCAGTFFHQGYKFDAGATLAGGFYSGGPMDIVAKATNIETWPAHPSNPAMVVHLPNGQSVTRWTDQQRWLERQGAFGAESESFWRWQEKRADDLWALALQSPAWPPQSLTELGQLARTGLGWLGGDIVGRLNPGLVADAFRPVASHLRNASEALRLFVDAQLLIAAQTTSPYANALYGASALDLPRRGVVHLQGGMGAIAETLVEAVRQNGGTVKYRQKASRIVMENGKPVAVEATRRKRMDSYPADIVVANLTPWNVAQLLGDQSPRPLRKLAQSPQSGGGAFMTYVGLDANAVPKDFPLHHQVIVREPMAEGNTVFLSLNPAWDEARAPQGQQVLTISTHTALEPWWTLFQHDKAGYEARKKAYADRSIKAAETVLPNLGQAANLVLPGTPVTFQRFTERFQGWVGGFPQTNLFRAWGPKLGSRLWIVGDSIFPGQSTAAVALGGIRVANAVLANLNGIKETNLQSMLNSPAKVGL